MEYFFIAGNVASLMALVGFLLQLSHLVPDNKVTYWTLVASVILTVLFWLYFYLAPRNRVKKAVQDRLSFGGLYISSSNDPIEVYEGEFTLSHFGVQTIPIPPFETNPTVTIFHVGQVKADPPSVSKITLDSFEVSPTTSSQWCVWRFRARGRQLLPRNKTS